jgi:biotin transport system substrate-specific component
MLPVPITMQTFAVTVVGAVFGWRLGAVAVLAWLAEGALGLPVFATGSGSLASFTGPTAGYLLSFPVAAALVGWCAERGLTARSLLVSFGVMLAANALMLAGGAAWLSQLIGAPRAIAFGVTPFLLGSVLKSGLAATSVEAVRRFLRA